MKKKRESIITHSCKVRSEREILTLQKQIDALSREKTGDLLSYLKQGLTCNVMSKAGEGRRKNFISLFFFSFSFSTSLRLCRESF